MHPLASRVASVWGFSLLFALAGLTLGALAAQATPVSVAFDVAITGAPAGVIPGADVGASGVAQLAFDTADLPLVSLSGPTAKYGDFSAITFLSESTLGGGFVLGESSSGSGCMTVSYTDGGAFDSLGIFLSAGCSSDSDAFYELRTAGARPGNQRFDLAEGFADFVGQGWAGSFSWTGSGLSFQREGTAAVAPAIPEPTAALAFGLGALLVAARYRRRPSIRQSRLTS